MAIARRKLLLTGAAGGMGRACARLLGATHDLVLTDAIAPALESFVEELRQENYTVIAARSGDVGDAGLLAALMVDMAGTLPVTLVHTAGLSPSQSDARTIMATNLVATVKLLDAIEPLLVAGSSAVLIASSAGHMMPRIPEVSAVLAEPLLPGFLDQADGLIASMTGGDPAMAGGISYSLSKQAVIALVERRAMTWGPLGARITSISPGMILTPMGRDEMAKTGGAAAVAEAAPLGRTGAAIDIAMAAQFLTSDAASFITGCDLKVDGGSTPVMLHAAAGG